MKTFFLAAAVVLGMFAASGCSCKAKAFYDVDFDMIFDPSDSIEMMSE